MGKGSIAAGADAADNLKNPANMQAIKKAPESLDLDEYMESRARMGLNKK